MSTYSETEIESMIDEAQTAWINGNHRHAGAMLRAAEREVERYIDAERESATVPDGNERADG